MANEAAYSFSGGQLRSTCKFCASQFDQIAWVGGGRWQWPMAVRICALAVAVADGSAHLGWQWPTSVVQLLGLAVADGSAHLRISVCLACSGGSGSKWGKKTPHTEKSQKHRMTKTTMKHQKRSGGADGKHNQNTKKKQRPQKPRTAKKQNLFRTLPFAPPVAAGPTQNLVCGLPEN